MEQIVRKRQEAELEGTNSSSNRFSSSKNESIDSDSRKKPIEVDGRFQK